MLLVFVICHAVTGACREAQIPLDVPATMTEVQCAAQVQPTIAQWQAANPTQRVKSFSCVRAEHRERSA